MLHKWTLLKFVSVYRTPLTLYLRTHVGFLIRQLDADLNRSGVLGKEELAEIVEAVKIANSPGAKGFSRAQMVEELEAEWGGIKEAAPEMFQLT